MKRRTEAVDAQAESAGADWVAQDESPSDPVQENLIGHRSNRIDLPTFKV